MTNNPPLQTNPSLSEAVERVSCLEQRLAEDTPRGIRFSAESARKYAADLRTILQSLSVDEEAIERAARAICWAMAEETDDCSSKCMNAGRCMTDKVGECFKRDARAVLDTLGMAK